MLFNKKQVGSGQRQVASFSTEVVEDMPKWAM